MQTAADRLAVLVFYPYQPVLQVLQKGYTLNGRLVRPAMVMVSKGS